MTVEWNVNAAHAARWVSPKLRPRPGRRELAAPVGRGRAALLSGWDLHCCAPWCRIMAMKIMFISAPRWSRL
ncbi:hypothetical protein ABDZ15_04905 [Mycobacterium canetti]|uniref:hypothetical protein n=1 Tax=Mycobacterium canetti TaxID=78331 RepID=UPI0032E3FFBB